MDAVATTDLPDGVQSLSELIGIESTTRTTLYIGVATVALLVYEHLITLDLEIEYMWTGSKTSVTSILFFVNRYWPLIRTTVYIHYSVNPPNDPEMCLRIQNFNSWSTMMSMLTVEILMLLRAWAVWDQRRAVGFFFIALCGAASITTMIAVRAHAPYLPQIAPLPPPSVLPCGRPPPSKYVVAYTAALIVEGTSLVFMLGRVVWLGSGIKRDVPILKALRTQGVYYFVVVISAMAFSVLSLHFEKLARPVVFSGITPIITSIACTRVFLEFHGLFFHSGTENPPSYESGTLPPYNGPGNDRKDDFGGSRRRNRRNLSLDFLVSDRGGLTTAQSTGAGVYELTTFENTTSGMEVSSSAGFTGSPPSAPSAPTLWSANASNHDRQHVGVATGYYSPPKVSFPYERIH